LAVTAVVLAAAGGLAWFTLGPGGSTNPAPQSQQGGYEPVAGYGDSCEQFFGLSYRDDFGSPAAGWIGTDRSKVAYDAGGLVLKPAAGESVAWLYQPIEYQRGFVCAKVQSPVAATGTADESEDGAGVTFWASDANNYYAAVVYRDGRYGVFRRVGGTTMTLVPKRSSPAVKTGSDALNVVQVLYSEPRYAVLINGQPTVSFDLPTAAKSGMVGLIASAAHDRASEWTFSGIAAGSDQPLRKSAQ
jgi:hypothetical protein